MEDNNKQRPAMRPGNDNPNPKKGPRFNIYWVYGLIVLGIIAVQLFSGSFGSNPVDYSFQDFTSKYLTRARLTTWKW